MNIEELKKKNKKFAEQWQQALKVYEKSYVSIVKDDPNQIEAFCHGYILGMKEGKHGK